MSIEDNTEHFSQGGLRGKFGGLEEERDEGNLYFDFDQYAEDHEDKNGRSYDGLLTQFNRLKQAQYGSYFPKIGFDCQNDVYSFVNAVFPGGLSHSLLVCNLSLDEQPYLSIRPKEIGPRLENVFPEERSLSFIGRLRDNNLDPGNPLFQVQTVAVISHSTARPFEKEITGIVHTDKVFRSKRRNNLLDSNFCESLPSISLETQQRLKDWFGYLDWKESLVKILSQGIRYLDVEIMEDGLVRFLVIGDSDSELKSRLSTLKDDGLCAFELDSSKKQWQFELKDHFRNRPAVVGDFDHKEKPEGKKTEAPDESPWRNPSYLYVYYRLPEEAQKLLDDSINQSDGIEAAAKYYLNGIPSEGFLAPSLSGDLALISRQRWELNQLRKQSGYAPFLSSYIFDINSANEPTGFSEIGEEDWSQKDLNDDQKLAVRKMISAPDLALIQGPPGTGKTTMIAEATYQFSRFGKSVLLVSQASLAVNNALERLPLIPEIRAIRLSRRNRINEGDHPYSESSALKTFYTSIANRCAGKTLDVWSNAQARVKSLEAWRSDAEFVQTDSVKVREALQALDAQVQQKKIELKALKSRREKAYKTEKRITEISQIRDCLAGSRPTSILVPEPVMDEFYEKVIPHWNELEALGIKINKLWQSRDYGTLEERSRYFFSALSQWNRAIGMCGQLAGDIKRLEDIGGETIFSPSVEVQLDELKRERRELQEAMDQGDDSKVDAWRERGRKIRDLEREGRGLDSAPYRELFNIENSKSWAVLSDRESHKSDLLAILNGALAILNKTEPKVRNALELIDRQLEEAAEGMPKVEVDDEGIDRLEASLRLLKERRHEVTDKLRAKEQRMDEITKDCPVKMTGSVTLEKSIGGAEQELSRLHKDIAGSEKFRETWSPLLEKWVTDLRSEETMSNDKYHFFDTYVHACNVVGVTCTEGRRTLEDAGHVSFDTVIVDEVSKATPTEMMMPLMMARTAILVGDHRQLPPLFKEKGVSLNELAVEQEEAEGEGGNDNDLLTEDNIKRYEKMVTSSLFKEHFENAPDSLKSSIFTQYRMHPQIMRVVNKFYENRLTCGLPDPDGIRAGSDPRGHRLHGLTLNGVNLIDYVSPDIHAVWLDSSTDPERNRHFERRDLGTSKVNELECTLIAKSLCEIEKSCRDQGYGSGGKARKSVGVVTFYGRQVRAIREAVDRAQKYYGIKFESIRYDINTVDRYQGQERPIILVSMVRNPNHKLSRRANTAQFERINVAFSRAQELLIIVGAKDVFCKYPVALPRLDGPGKRERYVYRDIIGEIERKGGFWPSSSVIPLPDYKKLLPPNFHPRAYDGGGRKKRSKAGRPRRKDGS